MMPGSEDIPMHEEAALRSAELAVRLDASEARAHNALGWSHMYFRDFERARSSFLISASLNPNDGSACLDRALALAFLGDQSAADETAEIAATLNPLGGEGFPPCRRSFTSWPAGMRPPSITLRWGRRPCRTSWHGTPRT